MNKNKINNYCAFENCSRKLKFTDLSCRCNKIFCNLHRLPELHNCKYNYKENINKEKKINEMKCVGKKIDKI